MTTDDKTTFVPVRWKCRWKCLRCGSWFTTDSPTPTCPTCGHRDGDGGGPPARVLAATDEYLASADSIARWVEERCVFGPNESMTKAKAFESWKAWAESAGEFVGSQRRLCERISGLAGVDEGRLGKARDKAFLGVGLRPEGDYAG